MSLKRVNIKLRTLPAVAFIPTMVLVMLALCLTFYGIVELFEIPDIEFFEQSSVEKDGLLEMILGAVIFAPIFETWLNQKLPYWALSKVGYFGKHRCWIVAISALFFGLLHFFSVQYVFFGVIIGVVLMYSYIIRRGKHGYWTAVAIHALYNGLLVTMQALLL